MACKNMLYSTFSVRSIFLNTCLNTFHCLATVLFSSGYHNRIPKTGWLTHQKFIFSQFCSLEIWAQRPDMVELWWGLSFWLADSSHPLVVSSHSLPSVWANGEREGTLASLTHLIKTLIVSNQSFTFLLPYLTLIISIKALSPNTVAVGVKA